MNKQMNARENGQMDAIVNERHWLASIALHVRLQSSHRQRARAHFFIYLHLRHEGLLLQLLCCLQYATTLFSTRQPSVASGISQRHLVCVASGAEGHFVTRDSACATKTGQQLWTHLFQQDLQCQRQTSISNSSLLLATVNSTIHA